MQIVQKVHSQDLAAVCENTVHMVYFVHFAGGGGDRDPKGNSLWLLPSGPDQVGEAFARDLRPPYRFPARRDQGPLPGAREPR